MSFTHPPRISKFFRLTPPGFLSDDNRARGNDNYNSMKFELYSLEYYRSHL